MAAGSPLVGIWEDVPWLILALLPPFGGPGLELGGRGLLPHSQPLFILALLLTNARGDGHSCRRAAQ
jgi:hypothetical protein